MITPLISRAQQGDENAWTDLYTTHYSRVYCVCLRITHQVEQAEDLTQDTFLNAWKCLGQFKGDSSFNTWLHRIATNMCLMHLRKKRLDLVTGDNPYDSLPGATRSNPLLHAMLVQALATLPQGYREHVIMHDIHGMIHTEVAEYTGTSVGNSKSQTFKAHERLREALA